MGRSGFEPAHRLLFTGGQCLVRRRLAREGGRDVSRLRPSSRSVHSSGHTHAARALAAVRATAIVVPIQRTAGHRVCPPRESNPDARDRFLPPCRRRISGFYPYHLDTTGGVLRSRSTSVRASGGGSDDLRTPDSDTPGSRARWGTRLACHIAGDRLYWPSSPAEGSNLGTPTGVTQGSEGCRSVLGNSPRRSTAAPSSRTRCSRPRRQNRSWGRYSTSSVVPPIRQPVWATSKNGVVTPLSGVPDDVWPRNDVGRPRPTDWFKFLKVFFAEPRTTYLFRGGVVALRRSTVW